MLHAKFQDHKKSSPGEDLLRVFTIYGRGSHLVNVTSIMSLGFNFLVHECFHTKFGQIGTVVSEKIQFEFFYVHDPGPRSRNDHDLQY